MGYNNYNTLLCSLGILSEKEVEWLEDRLSNIWYCPYCENYHPITNEYDCDPAEYWTVFELRKDKYRPPTERDDVFSDLNFLKNLNLNQSHKDKFTTCLYKIDVVESGNVIITMTNELAHLLQVFIKEFNRNSLSFLWIRTNNRGNLFDTWVVKYTITHNDIAIQKESINEINW